MLTVEEALEAVLSRVSPLGIEQVDLSRSLGRVLAEPVVSRRQIPPWPNSAMDGYAVRAEDVAEPGARLRVVDRIVAGAVPSRAVGPGEAVRIFTGAPLPPSADAVVPQEDVTATADAVMVARPFPSGSHVRLAGEDVQVGDRVLEPGQVIGPAEVGLLATLGYPRVAVHRRPRVAVLSTGSELADLGTEPGPGEIPNTNTYSLMAQVQEAGAEPVNLGVAPDELEIIRERIAAGAEADVIVSSAGVSVGELDLVREALARAGAELHLWKVAMRPGKPITFGSLGGRPVFGLPGNPVSAMVTFELFVRPALLRMAGRRSITRPRISATALETIRNPGSRRGYLRVSLVPYGGSYGARLTGDQGSAILRSMVLADGLAVVPGDTIVAMNELIEVVMLRELNPK